MGKRKHKRKRKQVPKAESEVAQIKQEIKNWMFATDKFITHFKEYTWLIQNDFDEYEIVLKKAGIENVDEVIRTVFGVYQDAVVDNPEFIESIQSEIDSASISETQSDEEFVGSLVNKYAGEDMIPKIGKFAREIFDTSGTEITSFDEKVKLLDTHDQQIFEYFVVLIMKLWTRYVILNGFDKNPIFQTWLKNQVVNLYERMNALYEMELVPTRLIEYIKGIEIPSSPTLVINVDGVVPPDNKKLNSGSTIITKAVSKIHFEDRNPADFERLVFAHLLRQKKWSLIEWLGEVGDDGGRDIWAVYRGETYCFLCANYRKLTLRKAQSDIDKLKVKKTVPNRITVVCGGTISSDLRKKIDHYAKATGANKVRSITGAEFEEILRFEAPDLIERFFNGVVFPDLPEDIKRFSENK